ncbi:hypothetical protein ABS71_09875 [bacterium SCN 62-11]|nr:MAG: hypothetical protein ABS71_09875 [bacterium SCN 62-11]
MRVLARIGVLLAVLLQAVGDLWLRRAPGAEEAPWIACEPPWARVVACTRTLKGSQALPIGRGYSVLQLPAQGVEWLELSAPGYVTQKIPKQNLKKGRNPDSGSWSLTPSAFWVPLLEKPGYGLAALAGLWLLWRERRESQRRGRLELSFQQGKALPGQEIGPYVVLATLGSGGMARVYEVHLKDEARERRALKLLHAPGGGERFLREARLSLPLRHPNLVAFYDYGEHEGRAYLVMEKVEGTTLDRAGLNLAERLACLSQVCHGLQALHQLGVVHRDLKPANIMISGRKALLMDFGIARSTQQDQRLTLPDQAVGTPGYMAPEQILGHEPAPSADLYALGVVLYESCCGKLPYQAETSFELLSKQLEQEPAPLQGPPAELCELVMALLQREPERRPGPAGRLGEQLLEWSQRLQSGQHHGG